jgi:hypothetical protein
MGHEFFFRYELQHQARRHGWEEVYYKKDRELIGFHKDGTRMDFYLRTMRLVTCLRHPRRGCTVLERGPVAISQVEELFDNPRAHIESLRSKYLE